MKTRTRSIFLVCLGAALLVMPQAAGAKPGYYVSKPSRFELLHARGSNGYAIDLFSFDAKQLVLMADRRAGVSSQSSSYIVAQRGPAQSGFHASFGKLGRVSLRFRPSGPPKVRPETVGNDCRGRASTEQSGRFVGSFRFRGERGFTSVHATSAKGEVFRSFRQVCKRPGEPRGGGTAPQAVSLGAYVKGHPDKPSFSAYELAPFSSRESSSVIYSASATERRGRMTITHSATAFAESSTFAVSDPAAKPQVASVAPPFPFSGTATFERGPGPASSWSGDLSVDLPGLGIRPLTGPSFSARLCRNLSCSCPPETRCAILIGSGVESRPVGSDPRSRLPNSLRK